MHRAPSCSARVRRRCSWTRARTSRAESPHQWGALLERARAALRHRAARGHPTNPTSACRRRSARRFTSQIAASVTASIHLLPRAASALIRRRALLARTRNSRRTKAGRSSTPPRRCSPIGVLATWPRTTTTRVPSRSEHPNIPRGNCQFWQASEWLVSRDVPGGGRGRIGCARGARGDFRNRL